MVIFMEISRIVFNFTRGANNFELDCTNASTNNTDILQHLEQDWSISQLYY